MEDHVYSDNDDEFLEICTASDKHLILEPFLRDNLALQRFYKANGLGDKLVWTVVIHFEEPQTWFFKEGFFKVEPQTHSYTGLPVGMDSCYPFPGAPDIVF